MGLAKRFDSYTIDFILGELKAETKRLEKMSADCHGEDPVKDVYYTSYLANMDWVISFIKSLKLTVKN